MMDRREILASGLVGSALAAGTQAKAASSGGRVIKLWPGGAPGGEGVHVIQADLRQVEQGHMTLSTSKVTDPTLTVFRPRAQSDTAILLIPGGGFRRVMVEKEGEEIARWLNDAGISAGSLLYRLPGDGWAAKEEAPAQDAKRAARLLAKATGAKRVGVMGFSAGGTIAAGLATRWEEINYAPVDAADRLEVRPHFMALGYPYLNRPMPPGGAKTMFHGMTAKSPPAFFFQAQDDELVTLENSIAPYQELCALKIPAALHIFESGRHGFALWASPESSASKWTELFLTWAKAGGYL